MTTRSILRLATAVSAASALLLFPDAARAENTDPDDSGRQYAWSENAGWVNAEPSGDGGPGAQVLDFELTGWLWGENTGWVNLSCANNATCGTVGFGVDNDGHGALSGYAWGENVGWISFSCKNTATCGAASYGVTIDPSTGELSGYAWSENAGWISFSCSNTSSCGTVDYGVKTGWCQSTPAAPSGSPSITVQKAGADVLVSWAALADASWYEAVGGDVAQLRSSGGDFSAATDACLGDDVTATSLAVSGATATGEADWYLVRGVNCKGKGTYDTGAPSQAGLRDAEVAGSGSDCP